MPRIKIEPDKMITNGPKSASRNTPMSGLTERFIPGGKHDLTLDKSFKREGKVKK